MNDNNNIYFKLQQHFNKMPVGIPKSQSGVEIRLLKLLFNEEEAQLAMELNFNLQKLEEIYRRLKNNDISLEELENILEKMYENGTVIRLMNNDEKLYSLAALIPGMYEYQLGRLTPELINIIFQYFEEAYFKKEYNVPGIPQTRTVPIEQAIPIDLPIASYDKIRKIIDISSEIGIMDCICRKAHDMIGDPCKRTDLRETCLTFGAAAKIFYEKGEAKFISKEKAYELIKDFEEAGLVPQVSNSQQPDFICNCCGCCCEVLTNQKRFDRPAELFASNYHAIIDRNLCVGCGVCEERCNMDAISLINGVSEINLGRCIGCGLCIPTCSENAIKLEMNEKETIPPLNIQAAYIDIMKAKVKLAQTNKK